MFKKLVAAALIASSSAFGALNGAGASFPAPAYISWAYSYEKATKEQINYQSIGSGGGIKQIASRVTDFGASDEPLNSEQLAKDKLLQFPALVGSIVLAYNIGGAKDGSIRLKNEVLAEIYLGKITRWNDQKIAADNPGVKLPDAEIAVIRRSDGSGTTFNFTSFLSLVSAEWKEKVGSGKAVDFPVGVGAKGNEGVAAMVSQTPNSIGYLENAYALKNNLPRAVLTTKSGKWASASNENVKAAISKAKWNKNEHFYQSLILQDGDNSYPLAAPTFILLARENVKINKEVSAFIKWAFEKGDQAIIDLGYIPLDSSAKKLVLDYLSENKAR